MKRKCAQEYWRGLRCIGSDVLQVGSGGKPLMHDGLQKHKKRSIHYTHTEILRGHLCAAMGNVEGALHAAARQPELVELLKSCQWHVLVAQEDVVSNLTTLSIDAAIDTVIAEREP